MIYEVVVEGSAPPVPVTAKAIAPKDDNAELDDASVGYGSIAAGGRYDELVGMFASGNTRIPCVGISFGVERIYSILSKNAEASSRGKSVEVFVMGLRDGLLEERMIIATELQDAGIPVSRPLGIKHVH